MSEPEERPGVRTFLEQEMGLTLDAEQTKRIEDVLGVPIDDEAGRWDDLQQGIIAWAGKAEPFDGGSTVQSTFERLLDESAQAAIGEGPLEPLPEWSPGERALVATRVIEGEIDNGGLHAVFYNDAAHLLGPAIEGFRLFGLQDRAALLEDILAAGFSGKEEDGEAAEFHASWSRLQDPEPARARYMTDHPSDFRI